MTTVAVLVEGPDDQTVVNGYLQCKGYSYLANPAEWQAFSFLDPKPQDADTVDAIGEIFRRGVPSVYENNGNHVAVVPCGGYPGVLTRAVDFLETRLREIDRLVVITDNDVDEDQLADAVVDRFNQLLEDRNFDPDVQVGQSAKFGRTFVSLVVVPGEAYGAMDEVLVEMAARTDEVLTEASRTFVREHLPMHTAPRPKAKAVVSTISTSSDKPSAATHHKVTRLGWTCENGNWDGDLASQLRDALDLDIP